MIEQEVIIKKEKTYIILSETVLASIAKDTFTFLMFAGLLFFNHQVLSDSTLIDALFITLGLMFLSAKKGKHCFEGKKEEAIKFIKEKARHGKK